jgi:hypothetical protein
LASHTNRAWGIGKVKVVYGFSLLMAIVIAFSSYQLYLITQLQSQINTLQVQSNKNTQSKIVVLSYSWTDEQYSGSRYRISVNCTLFNPSPENASSLIIFIKAEFGIRHIEQEAHPTEELVFGAWQTRNYYDLDLIYDRGQLGLVENVWVEPNWIG